MSKPGGITGVIKTFTVGTVIGRWRIVEKMAEMIHGTKRAFRCECAVDIGGCGTVRVVMGANLANGNSTSCGCWQREKVAAASTKHGAAYTKAYEKWNSTKKRCTSKRPQEAGRYLNRGIRFCDLWASDFSAFMADVGPIPSDKHALRRQDANGSYTCGHCDDCIARRLPRNGSWVVVRVIKGARSAPEPKYKKVDRHSIGPDMATPAPRVTAPLVDTPKPERVRKVYPKPEPFVFNGPVPDEATLINGRTAPRPSRITHGYVCGRWRVLHRGEDQAGPRRRMQFVCECAKDLGGCGSTKIVLAESLLRKLSLSCGCLCRQIGQIIHRTHGNAKAHEQTSEYQTWSKMITRCYNEKTKNYADYGGRGIYICQRWRDDFINFLSDMGRRPSSHHSIDRVNNDGSYTCGTCQDCKTKGAPFNCRWATRSEQMRNQRRSVRVEYKGMVQHIYDVADDVGMNPNLLRERLAKGVPLEDALLKNPPKVAPVRPIRLSIRFNLLPVEK